MSDPVIQISPLGQRWQTADPFLFCVHHLDHYPPGNERLGPAAPLDHHAIGADFNHADGWSMYHGDVVPGFPQHPHRGFETVTIVRTGYIDHSDSAGATARFGMGDVQWLTAGKGVVHSEMFPLLDANGPNDLELFQIWLNLPAKHKMVPAYFSMLWDKDIPRVREVSPAGAAVITVIAGALNGVAPLPPPPDSWAADPHAELAIWSIALDAGATWTPPTAKNAGTVRTLHLFKGAGLRVGDHMVTGPSAIRVRADLPVTIEATNGAVEILLLQGRPIGEPVAQHGPFVMNSNAELQQAFDDYRRTQFGGWPFSENAPVFPRDAGRFAKHADGRIERADG
jgi:hypothetical protein